MYNINIYTYVFVCMNLYIYGGGWGVYRAQVFEAGEQPEALRKQLLPRLRVEGSEFRGYGVWFREKG